MNIVQLFFIIGWPVRTKDYGAIQGETCPHCRNMTFHRLIKTRRWITIFFIPILPISTASYYFTCPICATGYEIDKSDVPLAKRYIPVTEAYLNEQLSEEEYHRQIEEASEGREDHIYLGEAPAEDWINYCPECGSSVGEDVSFCPECGFDIQERANRVNDQEFKTKR